MLVFHFLQFELNLSGVIYQVQKWKIYEVTAMGLNSASWGYIESSCSGSVLELLSKTQHEV